MKTTIFCGVYRYVEVKYDSEIQRMEMGNGSILS